MRIYEGDQAYVNNVIISGNTRTNEHVARLELILFPESFQQGEDPSLNPQLGVLGHFDPEKINPTPSPIP